LEWACHRDWYSCIVAFRKEAKNSHAEVRFEGQQWQTLVILSYSSWFASENWGVACEEKFAGQSGAANEINPLFAQRRENHHHLTYHTSPPKERFRLGMIAAISVDNAA